METLLGTDTLPGTWSLQSPRQKSNRIGRGNMGTGPLMGEVRSWGKAGNKDRNGGDREGLSEGRRVGMVGETLFY